MQHRCCNATLGMALQGQMYLYVSFADGVMSAVG
jgi:hypothetical protein